MTMRIIRHDAHEFERAKDRCKINFRQKFVVGGI